MNVFVKGLFSIVLLAGAVVLAFAGPVLALIMAYLLWGIKGALFTLGLLIAK